MNLLEAKDRGKALMDALPNAWEADAAQVEEAAKCYAGLHGVETYQCARICEHMKAIISAHFQKEWADTYTPQDSVLGLNDREQVYRNQYVQSKLDEIAKRGGLADE